MGGCFVLLGCQCQGQSPIDNTFGLGEPQVLLHTRQHHPLPPPTNYDASTVCDLLDFDPAAATRTQQSHAGHPPPGAQPSPTPLEQTLSLPPSPPQTPSYSGRTHYSRSTPAPEQTPAANPSWLLIPHRATLEAPCCCAPSHSPLLTFPWPPNTSNTTTARKISPRHPVRPRRASVKESDQRPS
jgi:hypothetical protein